MSELTPVEKTFDPERFRMPGHVLNRGTGNSRSNVKSAIRDIQSKEKQDKRFIKGPIPLNWLRQAATLGRGKSSLSVGLALWFQSGLERNRTIKLTSNLTKLFSLSRDGCYSGLELLQKAGLISIERRKGKSSIVTIIG